MEEEEQSPEIAARNSLLQLIDMIKGDSGPLVSQLKYEPSYDLDKDWEDIKQKMQNREYTTYSTLAYDLQKILDSILTASKKNLKQQRPYSLSHKNIKKQLDQYERFLRARLYEWHPGGKAAAAQEEEAYRTEQWNNLARVRTAELHMQSASQLRNALTVQQRSKDANINESIARILETSQNVTSTHAFGEDPLAVHTWLGQGLPWVSGFTPDDLLDSDGEAPEAPTMRDSVEGATAIRLEDGKVAHRLDPKEAVLAREPKPPTGSVRATAATGAVEGAQDHAQGKDAAEADAARRATEWKTSWIDLRIKDLSHLEQQLTSMISQKEARMARELAAAEDSPYLAGKEPRRPLQALPASATDPATCGFSEDALREHAFFKECAAAVDAQDVGAVTQPPEGTIQDMSDDETAPAAVYWAFASIEDNVHAFLNYISSEQGGGAGPATVTAAPSKVPKKAPPRPRSHSHVQVPMPPAFGRRGSERKPYQRRESSLPEEVRSEITRRLEKPYVPPTRVLTSEDIAARIEAESSGEDDTSDAYYLRLHDAELAQKDEADKAGASENRDRAHRRQHSSVSGGVPAVAGRARIAGKGPVSASTGAHAASATPSGATAHTHAGALSSGAARSTLPALPDAGASGGALATTATVGAAPGSLDRRNQPVPSFVVEAPHRFSNPPSVTGAIPGTTGHLPRSASAPAHAQAHTTSVAANNTTQQGTAQAGTVTGTGTGTGAAPQRPPTGSETAPAVSVAPLSAVAATANRVPQAAAATVATSAAPAPTQPAKVTPAAPVTAATATTAKASASQPAVGALPATGTKQAAGAAAAKVASNTPAVAAHPVRPPAAEAATGAVGGLKGSAAPASAPVAPQAHGVVRTVPRTTPSAAARAAPGAGKPPPAAAGVAAAAAAASRPQAVALTASVAARSAVAAAAGATNVAQAPRPVPPGASHRPRPAHIHAASAASPTAAHMHAAVAVAAAAAASHKGAAPGSSTAARAGVPPVVAPAAAAGAAAAAKQPGGSSTHPAAEKAAVKGGAVPTVPAATATPAAVPLTRAAAPAAVAAAAAASAAAPIQGPTATSAADAAPATANNTGTVAAATPDVSASGKEGSVEPPEVPEGSGTKKARGEGEGIQGIRTKRTTPEAELTKVQPTRSASTAKPAHSPRKKKLRSK